MDVNLKDDYKQTPLSLAAKNGNEASSNSYCWKAQCSVLDVNLKLAAYIDQTPLSLAAEYGT